MDYAQLAELAAVGTFVVVMGRVLWRLADRINRVEDTAEKANLTATAAQLAVEMLGRELNEHRVNIAKEYVTSKALESLESKLIEAINRLGDRLDRLFQTRPN